MLDPPRPLVRLGWLCAVVLLHGLLIYALASGRNRGAEPATIAIETRIIEEQQPTPEPMPAAALAVPGAVLTHAPEPQAQLPPARPRDLTPERPQDLPSEPLPESAPDPAPRLAPQPERPLVRPPPVVKPRSPAASPARPVPAPQQAPQQAPLPAARPAMSPSPPTTTTAAAAAPVATGPSRIASAGCDVPEKPAISARNGEAGTVTIAVTIGADGQVSQSAVAVSSGFRRLDDAGLAAIGLCRFRPATVNGKPEASRSTIRYHFE